MPGVDRGLVWPNLTLLNLFGSLPSTYFHVFSFSFLELRQKCLSLLDHFVCQPECKGYIYYSSNPSYNRIILKNLSQARLWKIPLLTASALSEHQANSALWILLPPYNILNSISSLLITSSKSSRTTDSWSPLALWSPVLSSHDHFLMCNRCWTHVADQEP